MGRIVEASRAGGADVGSFFGLDPEVYSLQRFVDTCVFYLVFYIRCDGIYGGGRGNTTVLVGGEILSSFLIGGGGPLWVTGRSGRGDFPEFMKIFTIRCLVRC